MIASLSLDLDNKWSYMKTHGDAAWRDLPSYLNVAVPRALRVLDELDLNITFFIVGQDAALDVNREPLQEIARARDGRHEIGNHSFHHEPWLHLYSKAEIEIEFERTEEAIERATGRKVIGFRGPGYSLSAGVLNTLARRGYVYDASTFPTFLGPLARAYYFMTAARMSREEREQRKILFGRVRDGLRPLKPYLWQTDERAIIEIPVTTMPVLKTPVHVSYLHYLGGRGEAGRRAALSYFETAMRLCAMSGVQPSLLLHPLDFLGAEDMRDGGHPELAFFPAMNVPLARKLELVSEVLRRFSRRFTVLTMREHAERAARESKLPVKSPAGIKHSNAPEEPNTGSANDSLA